VTVSTEPEKRTRRFSWRQIRTLAFYLLIPGLSAVTPLLVYPALTFRYGREGFASVAIAQSIGYAGSVVAELGWGVLGPQRVARADRSRRAELYASALATKSVACVVVVPVAVVATVLIVDDHQLAAALLCAATVTMCLSPSWFLVGANRPLTILWTEGLPRTGLLAAAAGAIALGGPLELYGAATVVAVLLTQVMVSRAAGQRVLPARSGLASGRVVLREQLPLTFGRMVSVVYTSLPIAITGLVNPAAVPAFAAVERLMRMALSILGGVPSRLQSWVGVATGAERTLRSRRSLLINLLLGVVAALGFFLLAPPVAHLVFAGKIAVSFQLSALSATVLLAICVSRGYGLSLVAEGRATWIAAANVGAAVVGTAAVFVLADRIGAPGAVLGELVAEVVGLLIQASILYAGHRWIRTVDLPT
jgi:O-antigen/teichoic acid export membrane protein